VKGLTRTVTFAVVASHTAWGDDACQPHVAAALAQAHAEAHRTADGYANGAGTLGATLICRDGVFGVTRGGWVVRSQWKWNGIPVPRRLGWWLFDRARQVPRESGTSS